MGSEPDEVPSGAEPTTAPAPAPPPPQSKEPQDPVEAEKNRQHTLKLLCEDAEADIAEQTKWLDASKAQLAMVGMRLEEVKAQLVTQQGQSGSALSSAITPKDIAGLKSCMKQDIDDVYNAFCAADPELLEGEEEEEEEEEEAAKEPDVPQVSAKSDAINACIPVHYSENVSQPIVATFRVHDAFTFGELREDMCSYVNMRPAIWSKMEMYDPISNAAWKDEDVVLATAKLQALDERIHLRRVRAPPYARRRTRARVASPCFWSPRRATGRRMRAARPWPLAPSPARPCYPRALVAPPPSPRLRV